MNNTEMLAPRLIGSSALLEHKTVKQASVLVACEYSGIVRDAFSARGWLAYSCDILPSERPGHHIKEPVEKWLHLSWDLIIAHPPCTYLSSSGMHWTTRGLRDPKLTEDAIKFAELLWDAPAEHICIENPVGCLSTRSKLGKPTQTIQPYEFGEDASKRTCLWLKNLPTLTATKHISPRFVCGKCNTLLPEHYCGNDYCQTCREESTRRLPRWANQTDSGQNKLAPSETRGLDRAKTYAGIAAAMADQWTKFMCL